jgi:cell division protein FtsB
LSEPRARSALGRRLFGAGFLAVAGYYAIWGGEYNALALRRLKVNRADAAEQLTETEQQVDSLRSLARRLQGDPATIEAVAREHFGMIRDGELLYRFVPAEEAKPSPDTRITARVP